MHGSLSAVRFYHLKYVTEIKSQQTILEPFSSPEIYTFPIQVAAH